MSKLDAIRVVDASATGEATEAPAASHVADALLREIADGLKTLAQTGEVTTIDLKGMPINQVDLDRLRAFLGEGEVDATVTDATGPTRVTETGYAGVWWISYRNTGDAILTEHIAITHQPAILASHPDDVAFAQNRLEEDLAESIAEANEASVDPTSPTAHEETR